MYTNLCCYIYYTIVNCEHFQEPWDGLGEGLGRWYLNKLLCKVEGLKKCLGEKYGIGYFPFHIRQKGR